MKYFRPETVLPIQMHFHEEKINDMITFIPFITFIFRTGTISHKAAMFLVFKASSYHLQNIYSKVRQLRQYKENI